MRSHKVGLAAGLLGVACAGLFLVVLSLPDFLSAVRSIGWRMTMATVISFEPVLVGEQTSSPSGNNGPIYGYRETLEFGADGTIRDVTVDVSTPDPRQVKLFYNPNRPSETRLRTRLPSLAAVLLFCGGVAIAALGLLPLFRRRAVLPDGHDR